MSRTDDPYYDDPEEEGAYDRTDESRTFPMLPLRNAWPPIYGDRRDEDEIPRSEYDEGVREEDSWVDEGLITLLLVAGLALFLFPEPATSALGIILLFVGSMAWLIDWLT